MCFLYKAETMAVLTELGWKLRQECCPRVPVSIKRQEVKSESTRGPLSATLSRWTWKLTADRSVPDGARPVGCEVL